MREAYEAMLKVTGWYKEAQNMDFPTFTTCLIILSEMYATEHGLKPEQLLKLGADMIIEKKPEMGEMSQEMVDAWK